VPGAFITGLLMKKLEWLPLAPGAMIASIIGGIAVIYAIGIPVLAVVADMGIGPAAAASAAFLPGDLIKVVVAGFVTEAVFRAAPQAVAGR
jgi:biotin transport system substrate-specific component